MEIGLVNRTQRLDSRKYRICMKAIQRIDVA